MALIFKASSVFRLHVSANISNTFRLVVRAGSDNFRRSFEHAFANSEDFHSASRRLTISVFHQKALAGQYLRRRPLYPTELRVLVDKCLVSLLMRPSVRSKVVRNPWSGFRSPFRANKLRSLAFGTPHRGDASFLCHVGTWVRSS